MLQYVQYVPEDMYTPFAVYNSTTSIFAHLAPVECCLFEQWLCCAPLPLSLLLLLLPLPASSCLFCPLPPTHNAPILTTVCPYPSRRARHTTQLQLHLAAVDGSLVMPGCDENTRMPANPLPSLTLRLSNAVSFSSGCAARRFLSASSSSSSCLF